MFAFYAVLSYTILIQTRRISTLHFITHVEDKFVPKSCLIQLVTDVFDAIFPVLFSFLTYQRLVTRLTQRVPLVEQELLPLPEHLISSPVVVPPYLVLCVFFAVPCLSFCTFSFGHCVVCSSSIYGF